MSDSAKQGKKRVKRFAVDNQLRQDLDTLSWKGDDDTTDGDVFNQLNQDIYQDIDQDIDILREEYHDTIDPDEIETNDKLRVAHDNQLNQDLHANDETLQNCDKNNIELLSKTYHFVYGGPKDMLHSLPLADITTPKGNTALHIAARRGQQDIVDLIAKHDPPIIFSVNKNEDTALHVATRNGHIPTLEKLLKAYVNFPWLVMDKRNIQGNTMLHEAMMCDKKIGTMVFKSFEPYNTKDPQGKSLAESCYEYALSITNNANESVLCLAVVAGDEKVVELILDKCPENVNPEGISPLVVAITKRDEDILPIMLKKKPNWVHLKDQHERLPLHYAASTGYHKGVVDLLTICKSCTIQRDKFGYFPVHLAAAGGHVEVVKELLGYCPDPSEMLDNSDRNILHIAAKNGKHELVQYILQTGDQLHEMINQKDGNGDTPLHLATSSCHPKTVHFLTRDKRVNLGLVNQKNQTALDIVNALYRLDNSSLRQQLTWTALKSAGAKRSLRPRVEPKSRSSLASNEKSPKSQMCERYGDIVETLIVVSTLIITASVAACLAVPGEADGAANNLHHAMFQFFIICITISFFSSLSATITLIWARLGLIELLALSVDLAMRVLGVSLVSLSLAFLAGIYTVISKLSWLATAFVVMTVTFVVIVYSLYTLLFLASSSTFKPLRYISYYRFLFLAWLAEKAVHGSNF